jgi:glycosyltransferase involved in cell wall biosynthesis
MGAISAENHFNHRENRESQTFNMNKHSEKPSHESRVTSHDLSVVIPFYNESGNILSLTENLNSVLSKLNLTYEVICIDDGSTDSTIDELKKAVDRFSSFKLIKLRRNFGQTNALQAGFDNAGGEIIITMDGDGQNDPKDIPMLLDKLNEGYDVISGWRKNRRDPFFTKILPSRLANSLIGFVTGVKLHDYGCTLKAYRREILEDINLYGEQHRYIPALAKMYGAKITEAEVTHHPRVHGSSSYGLGRIPKVFFDLIMLKFLLSYSTRPMQIFGFLGVLTFLLGFIISIYLSILKFFGEPLAQRPLLLLGVLLIFIGIQFISMGILGELVIRTYHESTSRKTYTIAEVTESKSLSKSKK